MPGEDGSRGFPSVKNYLKSFTISSKIPREIAYIEDSNPIMI